MGREVPWNKDEKCDGCGRLGAWDFMGDYICDACYDKANPEQEEDEEDYSCPICGQDPCNTDDAPESDE